MHPPPAQSDDELFDVVDDQDQVVGQARRAEVHRQGWLHRAVHVLVFNRRGEILLQRRSLAKDTFPGAWDSSAAGHLDAGETYPAAARRELREELGWESPEPPVLLFRLPAGEKTGREFVQVYRTWGEGPFAWSVAEVADCAWLAPAEVDAWVRRAPQDFAESFVHLWQHWRWSPEPDPLEAVRRSCAAAAAAARQVRIRRDLLPDYAARLRRESPDPLRWDTATHFSGPPAEQVAFVLTLDAVNFGSGFFPLLRKRPGRSGYYTVAMALSERFRAHGPFSAGELATIEAPACAALFGQTDAPAEVAELMSWFAEAWRELGRMVAGEFGGSFCALVESAGGRASALVALLDRLPRFRDRAEHYGQPVSFHKRAQLTAADLHLALGGVGPGRFTDLDRLTLFADNLVPHVLRCDGILEYDPGLAEAIDGGELLVPGSPAEVEIRAAAVAAVEGLGEAARAQGWETSPRDLDYRLWLRGGLPQYKARPRHRCRSWFY